MAASLPLELLLEIATLLRTDGVSLIPCTHVCRCWQAALEPLVYTNLAVYSDSYHKEKGRRGISLTHFQKLTSGSRSIRRNWIRKLDYDIIVPCKLLDWTTSKTPDYRIDNQLRQPMISLSKRLYLTFSKCFIRGTSVTVSACI